MKYPVFKSIAEAKEAGVAYVCGQYAFDSNNNLVGYLY